MSGKLSNKIKTLKLSDSTPPTRPCCYHFWIIDIIFIASSLHCPYFDRSIVNIILSYYIAAPLTQLCQSTAQVFSNKIFYIFFSFLRAHQKPLHKEIEMNVSFVSTLSNTFHLSFRSFILILWKLKNGLCSMEKNVWFNLYL